MCAHGLLTVVCVSGADLDHLLGGEWLGVAGSSWALLHPLGLPSLHPPSSGSQSENPTSALSASSRNFLEIQMTKPNPRPTESKTPSMRTVICILRSSSGETDLTWGYSCKDWAHHVSSSPESPQRNLWTSLFLVPGKTQIHTEDTELT